MSERHDPARLLPGHYPHKGQVSTRFGDLDLYSHVNNVATASLLEEGRSQFLIWLQSQPPQPATQTKRMIAEVRIRYLAQIFHPATLVVGNRISQIGSRSFVVQQALFQDGRCLTLCDTVYVHTDGLKAIALDAGWRERLQAVMDTVAR